MLPDRICLVGPMSEKEPIAISQTLKLCFFLIRCEIMILRKGQMTLSQSEQDVEINCLKFNL